MRELTGHFDECGLTEKCRVFAVDEAHPTNGAHHEYELWRDPDDPSKASPIQVGSVRFQRGPRDEPDSTPGTLDSAVLSVLIDRLECFQRGPSPCVENDVVLQHFFAARTLLIDRARERKSRGVLGKNEK